jgi:hypothetical protein
VLPPPLAYARIALALLSIALMPGERTEAGTRRCALGALHESMPGLAPEACDGGEERGSGSGRGRELSLVAGAGALASPYRLVVTPEVPPPPPLEGRPDAHLVSVCPLQVRAIVAGERPSDSFAVVAAGQDSKLVRVGEGFRAGGSLVSVAAIESSAVVLRAGEALVRCEFPK